MQVPMRCCHLKHKGEGWVLDLGEDGAEVRDSSGSVRAQFTREEAARSLGASWPTVMWRVVLPNIRSAVLSAAFLTVALVLGEFTIASLLNRDNLQVSINLLGKSSATMSIAVSLASLVLAFVLLFLLSFAGRRRLRERKSS